MLQNVGAVCVESVTDGAIVLRVRDLHPLAQHPEWLRSVGWSLESCFDLLGVAGASLTELHLHEGEARLHLSWSAKCAEDPDTEQANCV